MSVPHDPFQDAPLSALNVLDLLCEQRGWRMQLRSTGGHVAGVPSQLTDLVVVARDRSRVVASCRLDKPGGAETAARRTVLAVRKAERKTQL